MADIYTIARPYAQASFQRAREQGRLADWSDMLQLLATVAKDDRVRPILASPRFSPKQLETLFLDICGKQLDDEVSNLVRLLAENRRLRALPDLAEQFEQLRAEEEGTLQAELISAQAVDKKVQSSLADALSKRLNRKVSLETSVDKQLLGGAVIRAGDMVIDGSVRGRLKRMASALNR